jgi:hypothetical protein
MVTVIDGVLSKTRLVLENFRKNGLKPAFSLKFRVAFPKKRFWEGLDDEVIYGCT